MFQYEILIIFRCVSHIRFQLFLSHSIHLDYIINEKEGFGALEIDAAGVAVLKILLG